MRLLANEHQTEYTYTPTERPEISAWDEQDHTIVWDAIVSLVPEDKRVKLVTACEIVAGYIKEQREIATTQADRKARVDEIDGLLGRLLEAYPSGGDTPYLSRTLSEYGIVAERFKVLTKQAKTANSGLRPRLAA